MSKGLCSGRLFDNERLCFERLWYAEMLCYDEPKGSGKAPS
jgi:hypothetical protein